MARGTPASVTREPAQGLIEYALIVTLVIVLALAALLILGPILHI